MAKKKTKAKKITVAKARKKGKSKKRKRPRRGQYSNFFPTNRQIDSNQYWQLRAEIAGAEARVRSSLKDRKEDEVKADKKVKKLEAEVKSWKTPAATPPVVVNVPTPGAVGTPRGGEYENGTAAAGERQAARDANTVDLAADSPAFPPRAPPSPPSPVQHRGQTYEEGQQRQQEQLRNAIRMQQGRNVGTKGNIMSRWRTTAQTGILKRKLAAGALPLTPHNLGSPANPNTPTRATVQSVIDHGAPPASVARTREARRELLLGQTGTSPESLLLASASAARGRATEAGRARDEDVSL
jgi:hypothetical protein